VTRPAKDASRSDRVAEVEAKVGDGTRIVIRPVEPGDKDAIAAGFERLSPESRYRRFFAPLTHLTAADLRYLTEVDHHAHEALIGFDARSREPVGVARFVRTDDPAYAEVAVTVIDDWQGRGVATALLARLVARAREEGITHFVALVLSENRDVIDVFEHLAPRGVEVRRSASGHTELVIDITAPDEQPIPVALGGALSAAARGALTANPWSVISRQVRRLREGRE
jgi:GNAT superfamily N-acetyltransferase